MFERIEQMSLVNKAALRAMGINQLFDYIQQNKRCYARMSYMMNYFSRGTPSQIVLANWIKLIELGESLGQDGLRLQFGGLEQYRTQYDRIDTTDLTPEQKKIIKDYYLKIFPFLRPGAVAPPPPRAPLPAKQLLPVPPAHLPSNELVDKAEIRALNNTQLFDEIQQNKQCFARMSYIKHKITDTDTKLVLGDWISLMDQGEYLGQDGLSILWGSLGQALFNYRDEYNEIFASDLTLEQKQTIGRYYQGILPLLQFPPGPAERDFAAALDEVNANIINNNNNNNNNSTIANDNIPGNNINSNNNNNNNGSVRSFLTQGGKRKQKRKTRRSKKTRKQKSRKH